LIQKLVCLILLQGLNRLLNEAKVKIDEYKKAEDQIQDIISKLKPILPIRVEEKILQIRLPMQFAAKLQGFLRSQGKI
jgi:ribosome maturation protein SDO1